MLYEAIKPSPSIDTPFQVAYELPQASNRGTNFAALLHRVHCSSRTTSVFKSMTGILMCISAVYCEEYAVILPEYNDLHHQSHCNYHPLRSRENSDLSTSGQLLPVNVGTGITAELGTEHKKRQMLCTDKIKVVKHHSDPRD